jgi:hypothetical protein
MTCDLPKDRQTYNCKTGTLGLALVQDTGEQVVGKANGDHYP